ncbi:MAG: hypothetical protein ACREDN_04270, partial [Aestuariivirga sp.]
MERGAWVIKRASLRALNGRIAAQSLWGLRPMVWVLNHNRHRPVNLFKQHDANQPVGPGHGPERKEKTRFFPYRWRMAVGPANQKGKIGGSPVDMAAQKIGKTGAS